MKRKSTSLILIALFTLVSMLACSIITNTATQPPQSQPTDTSQFPTNTNTPITHFVTPAEPPEGWITGISDHDSSTTADQRRTNGGDDYSRSLYERPFNSITMDKYFPDLDIVFAKLSRDTDWYYLTIQLVGPDTSGQFTGVYGIEIDLQKLGRGNVLIMGGQPGSAWSTDRVQVWQDNNNDVGGAHPIQSDAPNQGNGYETQLFDQGVGSDPDLAWARLSPTDPDSVQVAFKRSLINNQSEFLWGVWSMSAASLNPAWFDFNDQFTIEQAGSPMTELTAYYPVKDLAELDNTCRGTIGFTPTTDLPGMCPRPVPTKTPSPGSISGLVYNDSNLWNSHYDPGEALIPNAHVRVRSGTCGAPGGVVGSATSGAGGAYSVSLPAGTYCVDVTPDPISANVRTPPVTVTLNAGQSVPNVNFGFTYVIP
jgi:hypothetical protein